MEILLPIRDNLEHRKCIEGPKELWSEILYFVLLVNYTSTQWVLNSRPPTAYKGRRCWLSQSSLAIVNCDLIFIQLRELKKWCGWISTMNGRCTVSLKGTLFEWQNCMFSHSSKNSTIVLLFFMLRILGIYKIRKDVLASLFMPFGFINAWDNLFDARWLFLYLTLWTNFLRLQYRLIFYSSHCIQFR